MKPDSNADTQAKRKKLFARACIAVSVVIVILAGIVIWQNSHEKDQDDKSRSATVIKKVAELYILPVGEEPTVASIQDTNQLKDQAFFTDAKNGDYLLVYNKAKMALIYRESADKLVNVGPISAQAKQSESTIQNDQ